jgi:hypothetical protein
MVLIWGTTIILHTAMVNLMLLKQLILKEKIPFVVRVGNWNTASSPSKEGETQFWRDSRCPGIWDNVELRLSNGPIIEHVQIIP